MIALYPLENYPAIQAPRRIMKYVLIYCAAGKLTMTVDEKDFALAVGEVITITSGQVHHVNKPYKAKGFVLEFTLDFF